MLPTGVALELESLSCLYPGDCGDGITLEWFEGSTRTSLILDSVNDLGIAGGLSGFWSSSDCRLMVSRSDELRGDLLFGRYNSCDYSQNNFSLNLHKLQSQELNLI